VAGVEVVGVEVVGVEVVGGGVVGAEVGGAEVGGAEVAGVEVGVAEVGVGATDPAGRVGTVVVSAADEGTVPAAVGAVVGAGGAAAGPLEPQATTPRPRTTAVTPDHQTRPGAVVPLIPATLTRATVIPPGAG
jgi:hypothetical protein